MKEKRNYERLPMDGSVGYSLEDKPYASFEAYLENIGFGGFAMYSKAGTEPGAVINFSLHTPLLGQPLTGRGKIRHMHAPWRSGSAVFMMGVEFLEINKDQVIFIINRWQLKQQKQAYSLDFMPF